MSLSPEQRTSRARRAAHVMHSKYDSYETTRKARSAFLTRFEDEVDPDRVLPADERMRRAEHAKKAYFQELGRKSAKSRSQNVVRSPAWLRTPPL